VYSIPATLLIMPCPSMVHQNPPHQAGSHGQEMRPILPRNLVGINQPDVGLVDERRGLKTMAGSLPCEASSGDQVEFPVNAGNQLREGGIVALPPSQE